MKDNPTYKTAVVFAACSREHAKAALEAFAGEGGVGRVALVEPSPGAGYAGWTDVTVVLDGAHRHLKEKGFGRPDLFVLACSNDPRYFSVKNIVSGILLRLRMSPAVGRTVLYGWSGPRTLRKALPEILKRLLCIPARPVYRASVWLLCAVTGPVLGLINRSSGADKRKILVVCLDLIGDLVWASPAISSMASSGDTEVNLLVSGKTEPVARLIPGVKRVITYEPPWLGKIHRPGGGGLSIADRFSNLGTRIGLATGEYETAIAFRGEPRDYVLMRLTGARRRLSYIGKPAGCLGTADLAYLLSDALPEPERDSSGGPHMTERNMRLVEAAGYTRLPDAVPISPSPADVECVRSLLAEYGVKGKGPLIGIQPGASRPEKRWSAKRFAEVATRLVSDAGAVVVLAGAADEKDICNEIEAAVHGVINLCGRTGLGEFIALVGECDVFVTNETSAISIASVLGTPVVCIMTGVPEMYGPVGVPHVVLQHRPDCYDPIGEHCMCPYGYRCLDEISVEEVFRAATGLIGRKERLTG